VELTTPLNRAGRQRGLREGLTTGASHARADDPAYDKAAGDRCQFFGDVLADLAQRTAAVIALLTGQQNFILPIQMIGQRDAVVCAFGARRLGLDHVFIGCIGCVVLSVLCVSGSRDLLIILKIENQLIRSLGFGAEPRLAVSVKFGLQLLDLIGL
jgi:hypothetical protein